VCGGGGGGGGVWGGVGGGGGVGVWVGVGVGVGVGMRMRKRTSGERNGSERAEGAAGMCVHLWRVDSAHVLETLVDEEQLVLFHARRHTTEYLCVRACVSE
jgi:hypothetical protein